MSKKGNKNHTWVLVAFTAGWLIGLVIWYLHTKNFAVLNPKGIVALKERNLMVVTVTLGLLVVLPVYILTFAIAWRYREGNKRARYSPNLTGNRWAEAVWWGIPLAIIGVLSVITWNSSHALDPRKPLDVGGKPLTIQVVALDWKWLFIYPEQGVAVVNLAEFPVNTPVIFNITADAPMNSFWIPQLGSQIYAMPGMSTRLNLAASAPGSYEGSSANISGRGFAGMCFAARAASKADFNNWLEIARGSQHNLDMAAYKQLARPSENDGVQLYGSVERDLYTKILRKYMLPGGGE